MQTEKIPFSVDKMKDAIRFETRNGREITQVTALDCKSEPSIVGVHNGKPWDGVLDQWSKSGNHLPEGAGDSHLDLFIIIEKPIEYPCLCWVSHIKKSPSKDDAKKVDEESVLYAEVALMGSKNSELVNDKYWRYSEPLTDKELKEFGLMRDKKC